MEFLPLDETAQLPSALTAELSPHPLVAYAECLEPVEYESLRNAEVAAMLEAAEAAGGLWDGDRLRGLIGWKAKPWESEIFGLSMAEISPFVAIPSLQETADRQQLLVNALRSAADQGVQHAMGRVPAGDTPAIQALQSSGFVTVDCLLTLRCGLDTLADTTDSPSRGAVVRSFEECDAGDVEALATHAFQHDRFHQDQHLDPSLADRAHRDWIRNSTQGEVANAVLVAESEGEFAGFVTLALDTVGSIPFATIPLVAVSAKARSKGIGQLLAHHASQWARQRGCSFVDVSTQLANVPAVRAYQNAGFSLAAAHHTLSRSL